ncbi:MAG: glycosyltransferase family 39 protein [Candidatus Moraniibacteriota bacterium]
MHRLHTLFQPKYLILIAIAAYFFFGIMHLTRFVTADEHYWIYERIPQYWNAIAEGEWEKTFINDKPGVTVALVSGVGLFFEPHPEQLFSEDRDRLLRYDVGDTEPLLLAFRLPILIANALLLLFLFWIVGRVTGPWIALWTTTLAALSPILLGISQIVNPDSLLWSFGAVSVFSYFAFLGSGGRKFLVFAIIFTGLAILTKYVALILLPFYLALAVFRFLSAAEGQPLSALAGHLKKDIRSWSMMVIGSFALLYLFLPALFFDSKYVAELLMTVPGKKELGFLGGGLLALLFIDTFVLRSTLLLAIRKICARITGAFRIGPLFFLILFIGLIVARNLIPGWDIFALIPFDIKDLSDARYYTAIPNFFEAFILEWNPVVFSLTPAALFGFIALLFSLLGKTEKKHMFLAYSLLCFFLVYSALLIFSNVLATPRYAIILYPLLAFLAALGVSRITEKISWPHARLVATLVIFLGSLASLIAIKPFFFNYTNFLLPKSALIHDAWGYGGYEAAQYLNGLPDAEHLTVWIDYYGVCEFFVGRCLSAYTFDQDVVTPDYYVLTRRGRIRYMSRYDRWERLSGLTAYRYYAIADPDWQLLIGDRPGNFIKVVKIKK